MENNLIRSEILNVEEDGFWPVLILIGLCCLEGEVGSDGWSVGFDCDCLTVDLSPLVSGGGPGGKTFEADNIKISPVGKGFEDILKNTTILVNR